MRFLLVVVGAIAAFPAWSQESPAADPLEHTKWKLVTAQGSRASTIIFDEGSFNLSSCNLTAGKYSLSGQKIVVTGPLRTTKRACLENSESLEASLAKAITENVSYQYLGEKLILVGPGKSRYVFTKVPLASKDAVTKFVYISSDMVDCTGPGPAKCLQIRENKTDPWQPYHGQIIGFKPVPGIAYRLRIKEDTAASPAANGSDKIWYLDMVVEQSVVDREAADAYHKGLPPPAKK
jgi:heat shock protein HslJ